MTDPAKAAMATPSPCRFRFELRTNGEPICGFQIREQAVAWGERVMGGPYYICDTRTGECAHFGRARLYEDSSTPRLRQDLDGATLTKLATIYNAGCCEPSFGEARRALERALASVSPAAGEAALAAMLMLITLHGTR